MITEIINVMYCHVSAYWIPALLLLASDYCYTDITRYKYLNAGRKLPTAKMIYKTITVVVCNQIIATPIIYYITPRCIDTSWQLSLNDILYTPIYFIVYTYLADIWFYFTHLTLHRNRFLYKHIHSIHHQWLFPMGICAIYAHPLEHIVSNIGSVIIGPVILPINSTLFCLWIILTTLNTVISHSGSYIYMLNNETHDLHHRIMSGNFGVRGFCDKLFGTYRLRL